MRFSFTHTVYLQQCIFPQMQMLYCTQSLCMFTAAITAVVLRPEVQERLCALEIVMI